MEKKLIDFLDENPFAIELFFNNLKSYNAKIEQSIINEVIKIESVNFDKINADENTLNNYFESYYEVSKIIPQNLRVSFLIFLIATVFESEAISFIQKKTGEYSKSINYTFAKIKNDINKYYPSKIDDNLWQTIKHFKELRNFYSHSGFLTNNFLNDNAFTDKRKINAINYFMMKKQLQSNAQSILISSGILNDYLIETLQKFFGKLNG